MKFTKLVAMIAISLLAASAWAATDADNSNGVVILNTNTNSNANTATSSQTQSADQAQKSDQAQKTVTQPTTVVEASPAVESHADILRKERQDAEIQTQQKIDEKLESSRLEDERARAERLFGNRLEGQQQVQVQQQQQVQPVVVPPQPESKATNVTIEKVEIVQPKEEKVVEIEDKKVEKKEEVKVEPVEERAPAPIVKEEPKHAQYYVSGLAGNLDYGASNVKSNYGLGVAVGTILDERVGIELGYIYSNHYIDTFWTQPIYRQLDQNDIYANAKYYLMTGRLKPYLGGAITYSLRTYNDRVRDGQYAYGYSSNSSESTNAVDLGVLAGVDFMLSEQFSLGLGVQYNFNVMNTNEPDWAQAYGAQPSGTTPLEKISYLTYSLNAKFLF